MRKIVCLSIFATAALSSAKIVSADAQTIFESGSLVTQAPANTTIPIQGFNPALGTLDEVDLFGTVSVTATVDLVNPTPDPGELENCFLPTFFGTPSGSGWGSDFVEMLGLDVTVAGDASTIIIDMEHDVIVGALPITSSSPHDLESFVSSGKILVGVLINPLNFGNIGDLNVNVDSIDVSSDVQLAYTYTPASIPEPSSWFLLLSATAAIGVLAWKRQQARL